MATSPAQGLVMTRIKGLLMTAAFPQIGNENS